MMLLRCFLFHLAVVFSPLLLSAQLEYVPQITADIKDSSKLQGCLLLTTKDFHIKYAAENHHPSTLQIIDPLAPWPPVYFAVLNQKYKDVDGYAYQDFRYQQNTHQLTLLRGMPPGADMVAHYLICDTNFRILDTIGSNEKKIDGHVLQINSNGERLYFSERDTIVDLNKYDITTDSAVSIALEIIEIADKQGNVLWRWNPFHHFSLHESYRANSGPETFKPGTKTWDWAHGNSLSFSSDGNILYSYRMLGVGKINRQTGKLMWKFGGKNPDIAIPDGSEYYEQHDFCEIAPGAYSLFSNGNEEHPDSRAIVYRIDEEKRTAVVACIVQPASPVFSLSMGSYVTNPSGLCVLNYGRYASLEERQPAFEVIDEKNNVQAIYSTPNMSFAYRVELAEAWKPQNRPAIIYEQGTLMASGIFSSVKWYELKDGNAIYASEQFGFIPSHRGTYVAIAQSGFGWIVSKPYIYVK